MMRKEPSSSVLDSSVFIIIFDLNRWVSRIIKMSKKDKKQNNNNQNPEIKCLGPFQGHSSDPSLNWSLGSNTFSAKSLAILSAQSFQ
jgi:hypothetical protein